MSSESDASDALDLQAPSDTDLEGEEFDRRPPNPWFRVFPPEPARDHVIFQEVTGPVRPPPRDASPLAYFQLFFTIELVRSFVIETNRYAASFIERNQRALGHASRVWRWLRTGGTTVSEIKAFVAVILDMGLIQKNRIADYWEVKYRSQSTPWFRKIFSRNRCQLLLKFFHIVDNRAIPGRGEVGHDPRNKFQNLIDHCNRKFKQHYKPREMLSIDESMVGSRNRCDLIQFMPNKHHHRFGMKLWVVCEASTGYNLQLRAYGGARRDRGGENGLGYDVVIDLLREARLLRKSHHLVVDNFYTSVPLARDLLDMETYLTGTLRHNRRFIPAMIRNARPQVGETVYARQGEVLCAAYREKLSKPKPVLMLSTHEPAQNDPDHNNPPKPVIVTTYNKYMCGVDISDMMLFAYNDERKSMKYWKKMVFNILHRMMLNAYIIYKQNTTDQHIFTREEFYKEVIEALVVEHMATRNGDDEEHNNDNNNNNNMGQLRRLPGHRERDCCVCSNRPTGVRHRSRTVCTNCNNGLHRDCIPRHNCHG